MLSGANLTDQMTLSSTLSLSHHSLYVHLNSGMPPLHPYDSRQ